MQQTCVGVSVLVANGCCIDSNQMIDLIIHAERNGIDVLSAWSPDRIIHAERNGIDCVSIVTMTALPSAASSTLERNGIDVLSALSQ